jgi:eukaryotic-like serine/threonine-protein kinase
MKCTNCGESNASDRLRCAKCGRPLRDAAEETLVEADDLTSDDLRRPRGASTARNLQVSGTRKTPAESPTEHPRSAQKEPRGGTSGSGSFGSSSGSGSRSRSAGILAPSTIFGNRYEILELVGEGGMGQVYKVLDKELDRVIALKTIRAEKESDPETVQRFKRELKLASKITHKNVVRIHDFSEAEGIKYFTMAYVEGRNLKQEIRQRGRIPVSEALPIARQVLSALQEAHSQGVIHRDLKPQNVMIDESGTPLLMDFGIARSSAETSGMTGTGVMIGTPDYMSPEQVRGEKADGRSDLFSFGVILYEMLTGDLPYQAETPLSKVMMRLTHKPRAPRQITLDVPAYLERVVLKCMEVDPALRYQSGAEVLDDLDRQRVDSSFTLRVRREVSKRKTPLAAVAVLVALAVGSLLFLTRGPSEDLPAAANVPVATLAILPFTNATGAAELDWLRTGLPEMLVTDISQSRYVRPVSGERVRKVMADLGIAENTRFDESALNAVAERAPAQTVVFGQYVESGGTLRIDLTLRKAGSGLPTPLHAEAPASEVFQIVDRITGLIKGELDLDPDQLRSDTDRPVAEVTSSSLSALRSYQSGLAELQKGENQAAIQLLQEATSLDGNFAMAYAKLADAYLSAGEMREAEAASARAEGLSATAPLPLAERYQIHATAAAVKNDLETAAKSFAELSKLYPQDPDILLSLAGMYEGLGKLPEAIDAYSRVVAMAPDYGEAHFGLAFVQIMSGNAGEAIRSLEEILAAGKFREDLESMGMIHSILGTAHRETGKLEKALEHYQLSADFRMKAGDKRGQATTFSNIGQLYVNMGKTDEALASIQKALAIAREMGDQESESNNLVEIGRTYEAGENLDKALAAYRESLQIEMERQDHTNLGIRLDYIANIYRLKGQYDDALVYLEQAKTHLAQSEDQREKAINLNYIGLVRKAQGLYTEALESLLSALALFQQIEYTMGVVDAQRNLAEIYSNQGRYGDALASLEQQLKLVQEEVPTEHELADARAPLGRLLVTLGALEEAQKQLDEADHAAGHTGFSGPEILFGQARLAQLRGRPEEAAKSFEEANVAANLSRRKEVAVESRIELGRLYVQQGKLENAERLLSRTRSEANAARLRPLEAETVAALANVYLAQGKSEESRKAALEAISMADKYAGRPVLYRAYATLGKALGRLDRKEEALDAYSRATTELDWIRGGLRPEHVESFMARPDIQDMVRESVAALDAGGRAEGAGTLRKWLKSPPAATSGS